ncbi:MAG: ABC transporter permease [Clostridia bacterium]|nr:ABC transporter permease [Clostridia bacterium]MBQ5757856.1 ABC transporter permease [Clostridia bacterium]MCR5072383.1 ABC transporter permease [Clostridiales bacterium]
MSKFLIRRILLGILIVVLGALVTYTVIRCLPASYMEKMARQLSAGSQGRVRWQDLLETLNKQYGMDGSVLSGFFRWLYRAVQGDFGDSWKYMKPVTEKFSEVIWWSVLMNIITLIVEVLVSIPLGIVAARKQYHATDYIVTVFALACISLPSFYIGTVLKYVFAVKATELNWSFALPLYGLWGRYYAQYGFWGKVGDIALHLIMPVATLSILSIGSLMRYTRTNMLEVLNADYIRTARAKGLSEKVVINKHAFRNTLIPLVTAFSGLLPSFFGGAMITETIFQIPGIGYISYEAMLQGDIPFAMFYTTFLMVLTQVSLILSDIMYAVVDPRVRVN